MTQTHTHTHTHSSTTACFSRRRRNVSYLGVTITNKYSIICRWCNACSRNHHTNVLGRTLNCSHVRSSTDGGRQEREKAKLTRIESFEVEERKTEASGKKTCSFGWSLIWIYATIERSVFLWIDRGGVDVRNWEDTSLPGEYFLLMASTVDLTTIVGPPKSITEQQAEKL